METHRQINGTPKPCFHVCESFRHLPRTKRGRLHPSSPITVACWSAEPESLKAADDSNSHGQLHRPRRQHLPPNRQLGFILFYMQSCGDTTPPLPSATCDRVSGSDATPWTPQFISISVKQSYYFQCLRPASCQDLTSDLFALVSSSSPMSAACAPVSLSSGNEAKSCQVTN